MAVLGKLVGGARLAALLARHPLPLFGDYVRLVRSLDLRLRLGDLAATPTPPAGRSAATEVTSGREPRVA